MNRGEIWRVNFDPTVGAEIKKTRPAVIISSDYIRALPIRIIVPITEWKEHYQNAEWKVKFRSTDSNGLTKTSCADCFQVRSMSTQRFISKIGELKSSELDEITQGIGFVIEIPEE
ncbi:MAG: type II toxin-antitoxin system PemK/MazF family toxin [Anaerolineaceae bacterium]|nr:type II toxin-antitoxin system PemK/MazF family toxin [Anaerolineaceae bacterium]